MSKLGLGQIAVQQQAQFLMQMPQMQQAIQVMQLQAVELAQFIEARLAENPLIDSEESDVEEGGEEEEENQEGIEEELIFDDHDFSLLQRIGEDVLPAEGEQDERSKQDAAELKAFQEQSITTTISLFEYLMQQAREVFHSEAEVAMAECLIGNFNADGYLTISISEIAVLYDLNETQLREVLRVIQTFEPFGVGASNLQESLLIQLRCLGKQKSLPTKIIEEHYDDLLHNRISAIHKQLRKNSADDIAHAIEKDIAHLDFHPGASYTHHLVQHIVPDVSVAEDGESLSVIVHDDFIPEIHLNPRYLRMLEDPEVPLETKNFLKRKMASIKWLLRNVLQRNGTLERIMKALVHKQRQFFLHPTGELEPITMEAVAKELELHPSTVARAVSNKYVYFSRGLLPMRSLFSNAYATKQGKVSAASVRALLLMLINEEDKNHPLSDAQLAIRLKEKGIPCARRTIAKYRGELKLGNACQRRKFN